MPETQPTPEEIEEERNSNKALTDKVNDLIARVEALEAK